MYKEPTTERMMLDLHMHLIPDVDDGAEDQMMARLMLLEAKSQGVCGVFCTPHSESIQDTEEIRVLFNRMNHKME